MKFMKYPSINDLDQGIIQRNMGATHQWTALEKIHGANYQFITDGEEVIAASRNRILTDEPFFDHRMVFARYKNAALDNFNRLKAAGVVKDGDTLRIFGELAGRSGELIVQTNADYGDLDFYAFDLFVNESRVSFAHVQQLVGFKIAPIVKCGKFAEVITASNKFTTLIDGSCTCEGLILRCDDTGKIYKHKNDLFIEKVVNTDNIRKYLDYINENRIRATVSKEGNFERTKMLTYIHAVKTDIEADMAKDGVDPDFDASFKNLVAGLIAKTYLTRA